MGRPSGGLFFRPMPGSRGSMRRRLVQCRWSARGRGETGAVPGCRTGSDQGRRGLETATYSVNRFKQTLQLQRHAIFSLDSVAAAGAQSQLGTLKLPV